MECNICKVEVKPKENGSVKNGDYLCVCCSNYFDRKNMLRVKFRHGHCINCYYGIEKVIESWPKIR